MIPYVQLDMVSYSSYDSQESPDNFPKCLDFIAHNHNRTSASPPGHAAYFVAEMDEYVYQYLCPPSIQSVLEDPDKFPPVRKKPSEVDLVIDPELEKRRTEMRKEALKEALNDFKKFDD